MASWRAAAAACVAQRLRAASAQQAAARRSGAAVEQREQRRRGVAGQRRRDLEIAARRRVERHDTRWPSRPSARGHARAPTAASRRRSRAARRRRRSQAAPRRRRKPRGPACRVASRARAAPAARSNCHAGERAHRRHAARATQATSASSGTSSSAGPMRSSTPAASCSGTSVSVNAPEARLSHAMPARLPCGTNAASRQSRLASSRFASVSVPGVTMRATRRSTGPLLVAGSPNCSTITTDSPCFMSSREVRLERHGTARRPSGSARPPTARAPSA